jgi:DNA-binding response OmpR family regulator
MKILVIEDDHDTAETLRDILSTSYLVEIARSGAQGALMARRSEFDLIILDLMLGDTDGLVVCKELRGHQVTTPILIVTGKQQMNDRVTALDQGADDYVTKPFHQQELLARVRALLRRPAALAPGYSVALGELILDEASRTVTFRQETVELRRKEFDLLNYLIRGQGQVLTRRMILDHVWGNDAKASNTVDVHIKYLRDKIDRRFKTTLIETVPGVGYKVKL